MSDRICIHSNATKIVNFSAANLLSCCQSCGFGCDGGFPPKAWEYWIETGIVSGGPYDSHQVRHFYQKVNLITFEIQTS